MKIYDFNNYGISNNLLEIYVKNNEMVINHDNANIVSDDLAVRLFLSAIDKNQEFACKISKDTSLRFSTYYLGLLYSLHEGNFDEARKYISEIKAKGLMSRCLDDVNLYDYLLNGVATQFSLPYEDNEYIGTLIGLVKKYLRLRKYELALDFLDKVLAVESSPKLSILKSVLKRIPDKTKYMVDSNYQIEDEETYNGLASLERKLVVSYEEGNYIQFKNVALNLAKVIHDDTFINNILGFLEILDRLKKDNTLILRHSIDKKYGPLDKVISESLNHAELYDVYERVCEDFSYGKNKDDLKIYLYKLLLDDIMSINKKNLKNVVVNGLYFDKAEETIEEYTNLINDSKFEEAKALIDSADSGINNYDFLIKEVDTVASNIENQEKIDSITAYADEVLDPYLIIDSYKTAIKLQTKKDPVYFIVLAAAYESLGNYNEALHYLEDAEAEYIYPDSLLKMIELFIKCRRYDKALEYHRKYETYYPETNGYDYYLVSIAYMNMGKYKEALDALNMVVSINEEINGISYDFERERDILNRLINGESVDYYKEDDYISLELDEEDEDLISELDTYLKMTNNDIRKFIITNLSRFDNVIDSMLYLLNIVKILVLSPEETQEDVNFIVDMICNYETPEPIKKDVLAKIDIYKRVVKL